MKVDDYEVAKEKDVLNSDMQRYKQYSSNIILTEPFTNVTFITLQTALLISLIMAQGMSSKLSVLCTQIKYHHLCSHFCANLIFKNYIKFQK